MNLDSRLRKAEEAVAKQTPRSDPSFDVRLALEVALMDYSIGQPAALEPKIDRLRAALDTGDRSTLLPGDLDILPPSQQTH